MDEIYLEKPTVTHNISEEASQKEELHQIAITMWSIKAGDLDGAMVLFLFEVSVRGSFLTLHFPGSKTVPIGFEWFHGNNPKRMQIALSLANIKRFRT